MPDADELRTRGGQLLAALTPHPHRGDLIAAGAVPLALGVLLVNARLDGTWANGILLVLTALAAALVLGMGLLAPMERDRPRSYQQVLLLTGLLLAFFALLRLAQVLGADDPLGASGTRMWIFSLVTLGAAWIAHARRSAVCTFVAALAGLVAALAFVEWAFDPEGLATTRWVLLALAIGFTLTALARRDVERRQSVYLIDAAGVAILLLGLTFVGSLFGLLTLLGIPGDGPGGGWKLVLLGAGLGLVAYAGVDREPGPAYLGALIVLLFVALVGVPGPEGPSLWFWPLALLLLGAAAVAAGLRPRRPLPPEPGPPGAGRPAEPVPGPGAGGGGAGSSGGREPRSAGGLWAGERAGDEET